MTGSTSKHKVCTEYFYQFNFYLFNLNLARSLKPIFHYWIPSFRFFQHFRPRHYQFHHQSNLCRPRRYHMPGLDDRCPMCKLLHLTLTPPKTVTGSAVLENSARP